MNVVFAFPPALYTMMMARASPIFTVKAIAMTLYGGVLAHGYVENLKTNYGVCIPTFVPDSE